MSFVGPVIATCNLSIVDIVNIETEGEALFPEIEENKKALSELAPAIEILRTQYFTKLEIVSNLKKEVNYIAINNQDIATKLYKISVNVDSIQKMCQEVIGKAQSSNKSVPNFNSSKNVLIQVLNYGVHCVNLLCLGGQGIKLIRNTPQMSSLSHHVSTVTYGTKLPINTLKTVSISKLQESVVVSGLARAAVSFGLTIHNAEEKNKNYINFMKNVRAQEIELTQECLTLDAHHLAIKNCYQDCIQNLSSMLTQVLDYENGTLIDELNMIDTTNCTYFKDFQIKIIESMDTLLAEIELTEARARIIAAIEKLFPMVISGIFQIDELVMLAKAIDVKINSRDALRLFIDETVTDPDRKQQIFAKF